MKQITVSVETYRSFGSLVKTLVSEIPLIILPGLVWTLDHGRWYCCQVDG